jgi:hypothetical protein
MATEARSFTAAAAGVGPRFVPPLAAIAVGLAAFAWLGQLNSTVFLTEDSIRDQLLARDCTDLGQCHLIGAGTSLPGFQQGAVWLELLTATRLLGGDTTSEKTVVLALLGLSAATLFLVVWRWVRAPLALPATVFFIGALSLDAYPSQLINPSASAFPDVLAAAGLLCYALGGQRRFLIMAAFALGVGINVHVGSLSLAPALVSIGVLARPQPWSGLLAAIAVLLATCFITSRAALLGNLIGLASHGRLVPALAGGVVVVVLSAWLGPRFRRLSPASRAGAVGCILVLPFSLASLWLVFWQKHSFGVTYLHPILGPTAVLAGAIVSLPFEIAARWVGAVRWIPTTATLIGIAFMAFHREPTQALPAQVSSYWTLAETRAIATELTKRGWSYEDAVFRLQGRACRDLLVGLSVEAPPPIPGSSHSSRQLQVVKATGADVTTVAGSHAIVDLARSRVAVVREIESWLRPEKLVACRAPLGSGQPPVCSDAIPKDLDALSPERFLFATRTFPGIHGLDLPPPYIATYEIPLVPGAGESRELALTDQASADCGWRITRAEGVQVDGQLPARQVRLHSSRGGRGLLVIEKPFGTTACAANDVDSRYPPCVFETPLGDPLLAVVEAG